MDVGGVRDSGGGFDGSSVDVAAAVVSRCYYERTGVAPSSRSVLPRHGQSVQETDTERAVRDQSVWFDYL